MGCHLGPCKDVRIEIGGVDCVDSVAPRLVREERRPSARRGADIEDLGSPGSDRDLKSLNGHNIGLQAPTSMHAISTCLCQKRGAHGVCGGVSAGDAEGMVKIKTKSGTPLTTRAPRVGCTEARECRRWRGPPSA